MDKPTTDSGRNLELAIFDPDTVERYHYYFLDGIVRDKVGDYVSASDYDKLLALYCEAETRIEAALTLAREIDDDLRQMTLAEKYGTVEIK